MTSILVTGADRVDAGKTTFSAGLLAHLDGVGFKPRAGNDYWFDHDDHLAAIEEGRLYGKDAGRLAAASAADVRPESINPVHRLWRPAPGGDGFLGREHRAFVFDRVGDSYVVNADAAIPDAAEEALPLAEAPRVDSIEALNELTRTRYLPHLDALGERIAETDRAVVESYGDVARPLRDFVADLVAVVEPERVRIYDGDRWETACEVATGSPRDGKLEERVRQVIEPIEPLATERLPPLPKSAQRDPDRVARAYAHAYEALI